MNYYTTSGKIVTYNKDYSKYVSNGLQGEVYYFDKNKCIKLYNDCCDVKISTETFELFKYLNLDNYYKIYDLLFDEQNNVMGYIMKCYQYSEENILLMSTEYTLKNVFNIYNSLEILAKNRVLARDLCSNNVIVGDSEITIIDIDYCKKNLMMQYEKVFKKNISNLISLMISLYRDSFRKIGGNILSTDVLEEILYSNVIEELFECDNEFDFPNVMSQKLSNYKRPIDYFVKKKLLLQN